MCTANKCNNQLADFVAEIDNEKAGQIKSALNKTFSINPANLFINPRETLILGVNTNNCIKHSLVDLLIALFSSFSNAYNPETVLFDLG